VRAPRFTHSRTGGSSLLLGLSAAAIASGFFAIGVLAVVGDPSVVEPGSPPADDPAPSSPERRDGC
jgi:hypothetical protein